MIGLVPTIFADAAQPQGIAALGIDGWSILAQAVTFLVLFIIIKKFALDKIVGTLEARRKKIDDGVLLGLEMEKEKSALDEKVEELLQAARVEADKIIAGGQQDAADIIAKAEEAARRQADALIAGAHARIDDDLEKAKTQLKKDMVELVSQATEVIIDEKVDARKDARLIERALEEVR